MRTQPTSPGSLERRKSRRSITTSKTLLCCALAALNAPAVMAQQCVSLQGSTTCPAFNQSSISVPLLKGQYPFLNFVSDVASFDTQFTQYIAAGYAQQKYQQLLGCSNLNLTNTTNLYARYTATFLCNALVQQSVQNCSLSGDAARPVCADTCAEFAQSEESIASTPDVCGNTAPDALQLIRADFTTCALPNNSLSTNCINGAQNEPDNCGFASNLPSLCAYCAASSPNATDSCCLFSNTTTRCANVKLPITTTMGSIFSSTSSPAPSATGSSAPGVKSKSGLSGGAIAGIAVGSVVGALLLLAIIIACCIFARRRRESQRGSIFNQPSPTRQVPSQGMAYTNGRTTQAAEVLPAGARVHQMTALEGASSNGDHGSPIAGGGYGSSGYDDTPESQRSGLGVAAVGKRGGSLRDQHSSPGSAEEYSSPEGLASGQSEQMSHFKDYYSQDDIRPNDTVAVLWAYQPRANDEWELERGDMLKVVGIWDDGWATGVKIRERAEEWEARRQGNRDSGVSNGSSRRPQSTEPVADGEIKAFPLVCVCLPQHWRKTIEGDNAEQGPPGEGPGSP